MARAFFCLVCLIQSLQRILISSPVGEFSFTYVFGFALVLVAIAGSDQSLSVKKVLCNIVSEFSEQSNLRRLW